MFEYRVQKIQPGQQPRLEHEWQTLSLLISSQIYSIVQFRLIISVNHLAGMLLCYVLLYLKRFYFWWLIFFGPQKNKTGLHKLASNHVICPLIVQHTNLLLQKFPKCHMLVINIAIALKVRVIDSTKHLLTPRRKLNGHPQNNEQLQARGSWYQERAPHTIHTHYSRTQATAVQAWDDNTFLSDDYCGKKQRVQV